MPFRGRLSNNCNLRNVNALHSISGELGGMARASLNLLNFNGLQILKGTGSLTLLRTVIGSEAMMDEGLKETMGGRTRC